MNVAYTLPTRVWPIGTLQRSLAEAEVRRLTGTAVDASDLGARLTGHGPSVAPTQGSAACRLPFLVITPALRWAMGWAPHTPDEAAEHVRLQDAEITTSMVDDGDDTQDWDTDDGPANDPDYWNGLDECNAAEDALHQAATSALALGVTAPSPGYVYTVSNPFTGRQAWFVTGHDARTYARASSATDVLDGDLGVWSASGPALDEYWPYQAGRVHREDELEHAGYVDWLYAQPDDVLADHAQRFGEARAILNARRACRTIGTSAEA